MKIINMWRWWRCVQNIQLYLTVLFISQLKKVEKFSLSGRHQVRLQFEQSTKIGKRLLDCELHRQAVQARNHIGDRPTPMESTKKQPSKTQPSQDPQPAFRSNFMDGKKGELVQRGYKLHLSRKKVANLTIEVQLPALEGLVLPTHFQWGGDPD